jgi:uncharacterized protein
MNDSAPDEKPEIEYPCRWEYRVFGRDAQALTALIAELLAGCDYTMQPAHSSRTGKYSTIGVSVAVADEAERNRIFAALSHHPDVKMVL